MSKVKIDIQGGGLKPEEVETIRRQIESGLYRCENPRCKHVSAVHRVDGGVPYCTVPGCSCGN